MQAPARSESTSLSAPRGGRCRLLMRSAGFPRQQTCDDRPGCGGILTAARLCSAAMLVCFGMPNAVWRQCDVCATAKASDGMLLSRVPTPGCCSPLPLGPTSAFQEIGLGLLPTSASGRATGTQPTSVTALGGPAVSIQLLQGPRGAGGPWPDGICPGPAQRSAARPRGAQLHLELGCSQPSTLRAA